jgi:hypothetical protein
MTTTDPSVVGRVLDAAREMARALRLVTAIGGALSKPGDTLVAAVDALETYVDPATERDFDTAAAAVPVAVVGTRPPWRVHDSPPPTHGTPAADPDSGPGWDQDTIADLARCLRTVGYTPLTPDAARVADQLDALVADRDRQPDRWRQRAETAEARVDGQAWADLSAERDRLQAALNDALADSDQLGQRTVQLRAEAERLHIAGKAWQRRADDATADLDAALVTIDALREELSTACADRDHYLAIVRTDDRELAGLRDELATARRAAAADALDWAHSEVLAYGHGDDDTHPLLRLAAEVRTGQRTIPSQPATTSTTTDELPEWERELLNRQEET